MGWAGAVNVGEGARVVGQCEPGGSHVNVAGIRVSIGDQREQGTRLSRWGPGQVVVV